MKKAAEFQYTSAHDVAGDGTVSFECSLDRDRWPWLDLSPSDPIVVQSINYWVAVETGVARGALDPTKWTALTHMDWSCGGVGAGRPVKGVSETSGPADAPGYHLRLYNAGGALVLRINGTGVMFTTRDFESWREKAKAEMAALPAPSPADFHFAEPSAVGVDSHQKCFVSPLRSSDPPSAGALVTRESGFPPAHPYHSGSGDHVNAGHLADVARQFALLVNPERLIAITGGEMTFMRFVELGYPFDITLDEQASSDNAIRMAISQAGHPCAEIALQLGFD